MPSDNIRNEMPGPGVRAAIYTRISLASMGDTTKTDDQEMISRRQCEQLGWDVAGVYTDNSRSAWSKSRKRPAWERMLADVEAGKVGAIVVYHGDRLVRQPFDLERLLTLAEAKGVRLASPTGTRDLDDSSDRFVLRILCAQACMESDNTSRRRKSQYERWRRDGRVRPGGRGGRAFGFESDGMTHVQEEADLIREIARRVLATESVSAIVRDITARGVLTTAGNPFTHKTLARLLARPRLAGLMPDGESKAGWEPVLGREEWELVRLALQVKGGNFPSATSARKWLLSGIATCGECGGALQANSSKDRTGKLTAGYECRHAGCRKVRRNAAHLDAYVSARVVARLSHPLNPRPDAPAEPGRDAEWGALTAERAATEARLRDYRTSAGLLDLLAARLEGIDARMAELRELADTSARERLLRRYRGISLEAFLALPLDVRRALVQATFTVTVLPAPVKRGPGFHKEDVRVEPL